MVFLYLKRHPWPLPHSIWPRSHPRPHSSMAWLTSLDRPNTEASYSGTNAHVPHRLHKNIHFHSKALGCIWNHLTQMKLIKAYMIDDVKIKCIKYHVTVMQSKNLQIKPTQIEN